MKYTKHKSSFEYVGNLRYLIFDASLQVKYRYDPLQQFKDKTVQKYEAFLIPSLLRRIEILKKEASKWMNKKKDWIREEAKRAKYDYIRYRF